MLISLRSERISSDGMTVWLMILRQSRRSERCHSDADIVICERLLHINVEGELIFASLSSLLSLRHPDPLHQCRFDHAVLTLASPLCIICSLIDLTGVLLNSRPILAFYNMLLWPTLLSLCLVGYTSYKRGALPLDRKLNQAWFQFLDDEKRADSE